MRRLTTRSRTGMTLVEMLVVLAILIGLVAILVPAVQYARQAAQRTACISNIRQCCLGMNQFRELHDFPESPTDGVAGGWSVRVLWYLDDEQLMNEIKNVRLGQIPIAAQNRPRVLSCPTNLADESAFPPIQAGHFASNGYEITDVPLDFTVPWLTGPINDGSFEDRKGPHSGRFLRGDIGDCRVR